MLWVERGLKEEVGGPGGMGIFEVLQAMLDAVATHFTVCFMKCGGPRGRVAGRGGQAPGTRRREERAHAKRTVDELALEGPSLSKDWKGSAGPQVGSWPSQ